MDCLFCAIVAGQIPSTRVYEDEAAYAFLDISPWHPGHSLVIPKRHVTDVLADPAALAEIAPAIGVVGELLKARLGAAGVNVLSNAGAVSGQEVFHLHVHVIPRYLENPGMSGLMARDESLSVAEVAARLAG